MKEQAQRTLYVRDVPSNCNPDYFKKVFEKYGKVRKFTLPTEKYEIYHKIFINLTLSFIHNIHKNINKHKKHKKYTNHVNHTKI